MFSIMGHESAHKKIVSVYCAVHSKRISKQSDLRLIVDGILLRDKSISFGGSDHDYKFIRTNQTNIL